MSKKQALVGIIMGSDSDWPTMQAAADICEKFKIPYETRVVSAHRTPIDMTVYAIEAHTRGLRVIIAGAGGAAHLPGMVASLTPLPVIGVPVESKTLKGLDSLLSIAQMPAGARIGAIKQILAERGIAVGTAVPPRPMPTMAGWQASPRLPKETSVSRKNRLMPSIPSPGNSMR